MLFSAIPLYAVDYEERNFALRKFGRCFFSDGGICSNFPIHFFDSAVPLWPTFGVKLENERKHQKIGDAPSQQGNRWFLPELNEDGRGDSFFRFDEAASGGANLFGFIGAILASARHWQNHMLVRAPGVRDRVLRVFLKKDEGGLNLNMSPSVLEDLTRAGSQGAEKLAARFGKGSEDRMNFDNHRWVRLRNLTAVMEKDLADVHKALRAAPPGVAAWTDLLERAMAGTDQDPYAINAQKREKMHALLDSLVSMSDIADASHSVLKEGAPRRAPVIRSYLTFSVFFSCFQPGGGEFLCLMPTQRDTLRHLFVLMTGLGMRESSGRACEGRDQSASNGTADTAKAGLFQCSCKLSSAHPLLGTLFAYYQGSTDLLDIFMQGVKPRPSKLVNFGVGPGAKFQYLTKHCPLFAVHFAGIGLRHRYRHWGPVIRKEVEIRPECDALLRSVEQIVDKYLHR